MRCTFLALPILLLALCPALARAEEERPADPPTLDEAKHITQRYLRITIGGQHAGGVGARWGTLADGRRIFAMRMLMQMTRTASGEDPDKFVVEVNGREVYDANGKPLASIQVDKEAGVVTKAWATYGDTHVDVVTEGPGGIYRKKLEIPADHGLDLQVFLELKKVFEEKGRAERAYSALDAPEQAFKPYTMTLLGKTTFEHGGRTYPAWKMRQKADDLIIDALVDDAFLPFQMSFMGGFMTATWVDEPPFAVEGGGWAVSAMVDVDRAVPNQLELEELEIKFVMDPPPPDDAPALFEDDTYQTVKREADGYRLVLRAGRPPKDFTPPAFPLKPADPETARYLEATPQAQADHADLVAASKRVVGDAANALAATKRIVGWVWANVAKRSGARGSATALEVLKALEGDCTEHATLTVALARAAGIPARAVGGLVYVVRRDGKPLAGYHAWAEVWLGRWVPVDATIPEVGTSARYARASIDEPGHPERVGGLLTALSRRTRIEVVAWKHFGGERVEAKATAGAPK